MATLKAGAKDIQNWIIIFLMVILGASISGYIVFCTTLVEFQTVQHSFFSLLKLLAGDFRIIGLM